MCAVAFACAVTSCNFDINFGPGIKGSGKVVSESRNVSGFREVVLKGSGNLSIDVNGTETLTIEADDNLLPYLTSDVSGGQLTLGTKDNTNISPTKDVTYKLTVKDLNNIELAGSGNINGRNIKSDHLKATIAGSGNITLDGTTDESEVTIAGSGNYQSPNLRSKAVKVNIMGSGDAELNASEKLDANIGGSGTVKYSGNAVVTQHIGGSGSVQKQ
jgi:hypothetical protein